MKIGAIIQARCSSTRLPNKILKKLPYNGEFTVLEHVANRVLHSQKINEVIIATSTEPEDQILKTYAERMNVQFYAGSLEDVLARFYFSAQKYNLEQIVRVTGDCPCIDPYIIDNTISHHINQEADYTSNIQKRTFPHGLDIEVFTKAALEEAYHNAKLKSDREHVSTYFYKTKPENFKIESYTTQDPDLYGPNIRITLDTKQDYIILCAIYDYLYNIDPLFLTPDIISLFEEHPWLKLINESILQKKVLTTYEEQFTETMKLLELQELNLMKKKILNLKNEGLI